MTAPYSAADQVEEVLTEVLESSADDLYSAFDAACARHPELADELRQRMEFLRASGLLDSVCGSAQPQEPGAPSFRAGDRLLHFEILSLLGTGGMGEVYRALDTRLQRDVAIKVLSEHLASDPVRLKRLGREARTLAGLNHPNVAQIHHLERAHGRDFLVLEYVPGHDLAQLIARGPMDQRAALAFALQFAEGLEAAHDAGVIHRDIKPANLRITPDGVLKVLDFGLATESSTIEPAPAIDDDSTDLLVTRDGTHLGTPKYMSPEQIRARRTDRRADIWGFGCVLWECLTGRRPFEGGDFAELGANILRTEPDWDALPKELPAAIVTLLQRCLAKNPRERLRDIGEARIVLQRVLDGEDVAPMPTRGSANQKCERTLWGVLLLVTVGMAWVFGGANSAPETSKDVLHLSAHLTRGSKLEARTYANVTVSENLSRMAWVGGPQRSVFVRSLDSYLVTPIAGSKGASSPFLSPDGEWVGFFIDNRLMKARTDGSGLVDLFDEATANDEILLYGTENRGGTWLANGTIVFCPSVQEGLFQIRTDGTGFARLTTPDSAASERTHRWPRAVPGQNMVVFTVDDVATTEDYDDARIDLLDLANGQRTTLINDASYARASIGALAYVRGDALYAQPLDLASKQVLGEPRLVLPDVRIDRSSGAAQCDVSADGSVCYAPMTPYDVATRLMFRNEAGRTRVVTNDPGAYFEPAMSPDGKFLAYISSRGGLTDLMLHNRSTQVQHRLTTTGACFSPAWYPDGSKIAYLSRDPMPWGIYTVAPDGESAPELLFETQGDWAAPFSFINGGKELLMIWQREQSGRDIVLLDVESGETRDILATPADEEHPSLSPDGKWIAFTSDHSGRDEAYIAPYPECSPMMQISTDGGLEPRWAEDGSRLTFLRRDTLELWAVDLDSDDGVLRPQLPRILMRDFFHNQDARFFYAVSGTKKFITSTFDRTESDIGRELRVVEDAVY